MVRGVVYPSILDYCTAELLTQSKKIAGDNGWLLQIHACQSLFEFHEILHRTTKTPIEWLNSLGILGPRTSLAHCFATTAHPDTTYRGGHDLELLAASGTTVAHCPVAISRRGNHLHTLDGYQRAGVNVAIGCDTFPRDMLNEMRVASTIAKVASGDVEFGSARAVVNAATLDAAKAIGRDDLGRLAPGASADLFAIDLRRLGVGPVRDPVDAALSSCYSRDIETVIIAGNTVVANGRIDGADEHTLLEQMQRESEAAWASVPGFHWTGGTADEIFPRSFPVVEM
jgi:cytosine/adenosine deaminase-related metal-dependent hydrolase